MKTNIDQYVFDASEQTIDFSSYDGFAINRLFAIFNTATNAQIYNVGDNILGYSNYTNGVVTLKFNTTTMNDNDPLTIIYDTDMESVINLLYKLTDLIAPLAGAISYIGGQGLRAHILTIPSTAVTGPITQAQHVADHYVGGRKYITEQANINNTAVLSNINNCTA